MRLAFKLSFPSPAHAREALGDGRVLRRGGGQLAGKASRGRVLLERVAIAADLEVDVAELLMRDGAAQVGAGPGGVRGDLVKSV